MTLTLFIQVRDAVGGLICKLGANILGSSQVNQGHIMGSKIKDWSTMLVESAESAVIVIQSKGTAGVSKMCVDDTSSDSSKEALKCIETVMITSPPPSFSVSVSLNIWLLVSRFRI